MPQIPLGLDNPRQIAYHQHYDVFVVGCVRTEGGVPSSFVKILDGKSFERECCSAPSLYRRLPPLIVIFFLHVYAARNMISCRADEQVTCVRVAELGLSSTPYIVVGTTSDPPVGHMESTNGRIMVLDGADAHSLNTIASIDVPGCVYALTGMRSGYIAAAVNSCVRSYYRKAMLDRGANSTPSLLRCTCTSFIRRKGRKASASRSTPSGIEAT